ncbi:hypothetical protein Tco_1378557 [Tanacetum coccineum]
MEKHLLALTKRSLNALIVTTLVTLLGNVHQRGHMMEIRRETHFINTKKSGKRRKQMARKGLHTDLDKDDSKGSDEVSEQDDASQTKRYGYDKKLQGGKPDEDCYKMLKMMEKQAD